MTYATLDDVVDEIDGFDLDASDPTVDSDTINRFIEEEEAAINLKLEQIYTVPVIENDSPLSFAFLKRIETWLVAWRVVDILDRTSSTVMESDRPLRRMIEKRKQAEDEMLRIMSGTLVLSDAASKSSRISGNAGDC